VLFSFLQLFFFFAMSDFSWLNAGLRMFAVGCFNFFFFYLLVHCIAHIVYVFFYFLQVIMSHGLYFFLCSICYCWRRFSSALCRYRNGALAVAPPPKPFNAPRAEDIITGRSRYYENNTYNPDRYKGFAKIDYYNTDGLMGRDFDIVFHKPRKY
jgi:hypothetical protein